MKAPGPDEFEEICSFSNLLTAFGKAAKGKRKGLAAAGFEYRMADRLLDLRQDLLQGSYRPGKYTHFFIHEPKKRLISAAPFRDRVVHHALCNVIEPLFEERFIADSYANRINKGTHRAVERLQEFARHHETALRLDIVQHFPSIDHEILAGILEPVIANHRAMDLVRKILASGNGADSVCWQRPFAGDDLLDLCRPRGLPIGNLTSQFWSNCYLHPLDVFVKRELGCRAYLRYVDDCALFSNSTPELWAWKGAIREKLASLRLRFHEHNAQCLPTRCGIPWLGFVVYPDHKRIKARKVVHGTRRLVERFDAWQRGEISFAEFDASVKGWVNHVRYADSWGLRRKVLGRFRW
jgi:hypothetical protein